VADAAMMVSVEAAVCSQPERPKTNSQVIILQVLKLDKGPGVFP
jgi:hypothetical protein